MRFKEEEISEKIHIAQLEGIGERLEEDIAGILTGRGFIFVYFIVPKRRLLLSGSLQRADMDLLRMKRNCRI